MKTQDQRLRELASIRLDLSSMTEGMKRAIIQFGADCMDEGYTNGINEERESNMFNNRVLDELFVK
jgi:hypothetical protein